MTNQRFGAQPTALIAGLAIVLVGALGLIALFALNLGPFSGSPTASPGLPTPLPGQSSPATPGPSSASPGATARQTSLPSTQPPTGQPTTAVPSPASPEEALLLHVPADIRSTCTSGSGRGHVLVLASCTGNDGAIGLTYFEYDSPASMAEAYAGLRLASEIEPSSGNCSDHSTWPAESTYEVENEEAGRRLCTDQPGSPTIYWTDDRLSILSQAAGVAPDYEQLVDFWTTQAGPIL